MSHTRDHKNCEACEKLRAMHHTDIVTSMGFADAGAIWIEHHRQYIRPSTLRVYKQYVECLARFFERQPLSSIHIGSVRAFQAWRLEKAGPGRINSEVSALQMILKEAGLWDKIGQLHRALPVPKRKVRQNMSEAQEKRLREVVWRLPTKRKVAGHCLLIMANTTMGFGELRHVRREDVHLEDDIPFVEVNAGAKNVRVRTIPLNDVALASMLFLVRRWEQIGGKLPGQFLLPQRAKRQGDPPQFDVPMGHIYRAATQILEEAGLGHLSPYDMRSHAITKLLSNPEVSDQVYEEIAGYVGRQMRRRYSKQRMENKRRALDGLLKPKDDKPKIASIAEYRSLWKAGA